MRRVPLGLEFFGFRTRNLEPPLFLLVPTVDDI